MRHCKFYVAKGASLEIGSSCSLNGLILHVQEGGSIRIGNGVTVNADKESPTLMNAFGGQSITLGDNCLLSDGIQIHTTDYHTLLQDGERYNYPKSVIIGEHCWIGLGAIILKGVSLPAGTVVGARAVVSKSINQNSAIIAGNPAKVIKTGINWDKKRI